MSSLTLTEKKYFESMLDMNSGWVSDFSDDTFGEFFKEHVQIDIHNEKYQDHGSSKAKKMRSFWEKEDDPIVGQLLEAITDHCIQISITEDKKTPSETVQCRQICKRLLNSNHSFFLSQKNSIPFNSKYIHEQIRRMQESTNKDPSLAIGTAKELIETICKTILEKREKIIQGNPDLPKLIKETLKELKLLPESIPETAKGYDIIKKLLRNMASIAQSMGELRNLYGTGHGKTGHSSGLESRHAKLAVGVATTLVIFLFDTYSKMNNLELNNQTQTNQNQA